jgi:hypothetical protein
MAGPFAAIKPAAAAPFQKDRRVIVMMSLL